MRATIISLAMSRFVASGPNGDMAVTADLEADARVATIQIDVDVQVPLTISSRRLAELVGLCESVQQALWQTRPETVLTTELNATPTLPATEAPQSPPTPSMPAQVYQGQQTQVAPSRPAQDAQGRQPQARSGLGLTDRQWDYLNNLIADNGLDNNSALQLGYGMRFFPESVDTLDKLDRQQGSKLIEELRGRLMREKAVGQEIPR